MLYCNERVTIIQFLLYCEGTSDDHVVLQGIKLVYILLQGQMKTTFNHCVYARFSFDSMAMMAHHATIKVSYAVERKKQQRWAYFHVLSRWVGNDNFIFWVILQGSKWQYNNATIARTQGIVVRVWWWWPTTQQSNILYAVIRNDDGKWACITRSNDNEHTFNVVLRKKQRQICFWCWEQRSYCQRACDDSDSNIARHEDATINFYMLLIKGWQQ